MSNAVSAREVPHCKCGTDRDSKFCVIERQYGFFGILYLVWGGTAIPTKVTFKCVKCGTLIDSTTSESECRRYIT
jgi:hypothetical protein